MTQSRSWVCSVGTCSCDVDAPANSKLPLSLRRVARGRVASRPVPVGLPCCRRSLDSALPLGLSHAARSLGASGEARLIVMLPWLHAQHLVAQPSGTCSRAAPNQDASMRRG